MNSLHDSTGTVPRERSVDTDHVDPRRLAAFFGVLVLLAVLFLLVSLLADVSMVTLAPAYMFTPLVAALAVSRAWRIPLRRIGLRRGRVRWLVASVLLALPLVLAMLALSIATPGIAFDPTADPGLGVAWPTGVAGVAASLVLILAVGTTVNAVLAFGEELGWRGYLLWELAPLGFWRASVIIGASWGIWHAPIIVEGYNFPSFPIIGVGVMTLACVAFAPLYTYVVVKARSVLAAALLHGVFNGSAGMVLIYTTTEHAVLEDLVANPVGVAGMVVFAAVTAVIAVRGAPRLDRSFARDSAAPGQPQRPARVGGRHE